MLGLLEAEEGDVLIDGRSLRRFGHRAFHAQVGTALQDDSLFAGTLAENIALFEESASSDALAAAASGAGIHEQIMAMPMGYQSVVGDMGSALSGGQKQRVLLARAL